MEIRVWLFTFLVTALIALETSLFVAVKDSPPSDRCSDSLSVAAFDWASLLFVPSFPEASRIKVFTRIDLRQVSGINTDLAI